MFFVFVGNVFLWDKDSESIVNMIRGDVAGVVSDETQTILDTSYRTGRHASELKAPSVMDLVIA